MPEMCFQKMWIYFVTITEEIIGADVLFTSILKSGQRFNSKINLKVN
jgi:hypothetical protein